MHFDFDEVRSKVKTDIMEGDHMFKSMPHYMSVGESALKAIVASFLLANQKKSPETILDFASGSGRVARWLCAAYPNAKVHASDLRDDSLAFLSKTFGIETWPSSESIEDIVPPAQYDLIWCGSLLTHLSEAKTRDMLVAFHKWLKPGGIAVVTTHGKKVLDNIASGMRYMEPDQRLAFLSQAAYRGYGYVDYTGRTIGVSVNSLEWLCREVQRLNARMITISDHAWDNHQDVFAFQKTSPA